MTPPSLASRRHCLHLYLRAASPQPRGDLPRRRLACIYDVELNWGRCVAALCWLPVASVYKVLWSRVAKEERWHTLALMRRVLPLSTVFLLGLVPPTHRARCTSMDAASGGRGGLGRRRLLRQLVGGPVITACLSLAFTSPLSLPSPSPAPSSSPNPHSRPSR